MTCASGADLSHCIIEAKIKLCLITAVENVIAEVGDDNKICNKYSFMQYCC